MRKIFNTAGKLFLRRVKKLFLLIQLNSYGITLGISVYAKLWSFVHFFRMNGKSNGKVRQIWGFKQEYQIEFWIRRRPVRNDYKFATDGHHWIIFSKCVI